MQGALVLMIAHGVSTPMLFFLLGMLYERRHSYEIADFGGLAASRTGLRDDAGVRGAGLDRAAGHRAASSPSSWCWSAPSSVSPWIALIAATGVIFAAYYMLPDGAADCLQRAGQAGQPEHPGPERGASSRFSLPLVALILWIGYLPEAVPRPDGARR